MLAAEACVIISKVNKELKQKFLQGIKKDKKKDTKAKKVLKFKIEKMDNTG
jgi:hypothetical protein